MRAKHKEHDNFDQINGDSKIKLSGVLINRMKYIKKSLVTEHLKNSSNLSLGTDPSKN